jgi:hypothetical protein
VQNVLMPLERLYDGGPCGNDKSNKQNCTDHHVFNPSEEMDRALCGHSGEWNPDFGQCSYDFLDAATFLLRDVRGRWHWIWRGLSSGRLVGEIEGLGACTITKQLGHGSLAPNVR